MKDKLKMLQETFKQMELSTKYKKEDYELFKEALKLIERSEKYEPIKVVKKSSLISFINKTINKMNKYALKLGALNIYCKIVKLKENSDYLKLLGKHPIFYFIEFNIKLKILNILLSIITSQFVQNKIRNFADSNNNKIENITNYRNQLSLKAEKLALEDNTTLIWTIKCIILHIRNFILRMELFILYKILKIEVWVGINRE